MQSQGNISIFPCYEHGVKLHLLDCREQWLECCKRAFEGLERDSAGRVTSSSLLEGLRSRLPAAEIEYAVEDALVEAGYAGMIEKNEKIKRTGAVAFRNLA